MRTKDPLKPIGPWEVKRKINVPSLARSEHALEIERSVSSIKGVCTVVTDAHKHQISVRYDASKTDYQSILKAIESTGFLPLDNWWARFKGGWIQYADTNTRDNAKAPPPACCNKPPK